MLTKVLLLSLAPILCASTSLAQTGGSAFVLSRFGLHVDGNSFTRKDGVYFSGGPGFTCSASGLADGDYCFEITDPAGTVLLAPDPITARSARRTRWIFAHHRRPTP